MRSRAGGHDVVATRAGTPGAPAYVLVHGIGVSGRYFGPLTDELAEVGDVLVPDLPGFGRSARPREVLSIAAHARVVAALVAEHGLVAPVVVGHSMGCQIVAELLAVHPGTAARGVLVGPVTNTRERTAVRQGMRLLQDGAHEPMRVNAMITADYVRCGPRRYAATLPHMLDYPLAERLGDATAPVVLVRGENDPIAPRYWLDELAAAAPTVGVAEVPDSGHVAMYTEPAVVADLCRGVTC